MPSTITSFTTFVAGTKARATEVNANFSNFRGDLLPVNTDTATASDGTHNLGRSDHRWNDLYLSGSIISASGQTSGVIPVGTVISCAFSTAPSGYLLCNGSSVSRSTYAALFRWMTDGTNTSPCFGYETSTNFNLPDLRGKFMRGVDIGAGNDPDAASRTAQGTNGSTGDSIGSIQADATAPNGMSTASGGTHTHNLNILQDGSNPFPPAARVIGNTATTLGSSVYSSSSFITPSGAHQHTLAGDNETRPLNVFFNYFIKY